MNAKNAFTLKYLSGVVIKFEILKGNITDLIPLLPTSIKTFLNNIKICCMFCVVSTFLVNYQFDEIHNAFKCAKICIENWTNINNCTNINKCSLMTLMKCAKHENHSDCVEYIHNYSIKNLVIKYEDFFIVSLTGCSKQCCL